MHYGLGLVQGKILHFGEGFGLVVGACLTAGRSAKEVGKFLGTDLILANNRLK